MIIELKGQVATRRSSLVAELEKLERHREQIVHEVTCIDVILAEIEKHVKATNKQSTKTKRRGKSDKKSPEKPEVATAAFELIASNGGQMDANKLYEEIKGRIKSTGKNNMAVGILLKQLRDSNQLIEIAPGILSLAKDIDANASSLNPVNGAK